MSRVSRRPPDAASGAHHIIFEFTRIGDQMKVAAVDAETGAEASVFGPAGAARADLERLALNKLRYVMGEGREAPAAAPPPSSRPGRLV